MAPVITALRASPVLRASVCVSGQHRGLLDQALEQHGIVADADFALMRPGQDNASLAGRLLDAAGKYLAEKRPDMVLVHGDTTTSVAFALAAFYAGVPVGHVEAGLRSGDLAAPFPEEGNRRLTSVIARLHFAPTQRAAEALLREGAAAERVFVTGNTVVDALVEQCRCLDVDPPLEQRLLGMAGLTAADTRPVVLVTAHRRESIGAGLAGICEGLRRIAARFPDVAIIYPAHPNPAVQQAVADLLGPLTGVRVTPPLAPLAFVALMRRSAFIMTDSGGVQEEAPTLRRPVLVMRERTERPEGVEAGLARLVGTDPDRVLAEATALLTNPQQAAAMTAAANPFGDGHAAARIVAAVEAHLAPASAVGVCRLSA